MPSSYSTSLRLELVATGEQANAWGVTNNRNLGTLIEQAIAGVVGVVMGNADYTLTTASGLTDEARNAAIRVTSSTALTAIRSIIVPNVQKTYLVWNATTGGFPILVKTSGGTGTFVQPGNRVLITCDGSGAGLCTAATPGYNPSTDYTVGSGCTFTVGTFTTLTIGGAAVWTAANLTPSNYQPVLGYTPVQQGTGVGQLGNVIKLGWSAGSRLKATVDSTDLGNLATDTSILTGVTTGPIVCTTVTGSSYVSCQSPRGGGTGRAIVASDTRFGPWRWVDAGTYVEIDVDGNARSIATAASDERLKEDITPSHFNALDAIRRLAFIDFRFKKMPGCPDEVVMPLQRGGISAQQAQTINPAWVNEMGDEQGTLAPNLQLLVTNALQAIQALDGQVRALQARLGMD